MMGAVAALRVASTLVGALLGGVVPVDAVVDARRAANAASGHIPNMDPGVMLVIAMMLVAAVVVVILVVELVRCWALGGVPLTVPSHALLGFVAAFPIGLAFAVEWFRSAGSAGVLIAGAVIILFYAALCVRSARKRRGTIERNNAA
jgi:hypothetical protein